MQKYKNPNQHLIAPGHTACPGCGQLMSARLVLDACGSKTIIANATGCLEVTTTKYPTSSWKVPWVHSLFENPSAVASGILAALKQKGLDKEITVLAQGGDGSTFDIGFGLISGMWERKENILYVCYNTEVYSNTGYQASGATPLDANTTTTPPDKKSMGNAFIRKNMGEIAIAHGCVYVAQTTCGYPADIINKVKKALTFTGPKYLEILTTCIPGWGVENEMAVQMGKLAHKTGIYPVFEYYDDEYHVMKIPGEPLKVDEYLKLHKRFKHLFGNERGKEAIKQIQNIADKNIEKYNLK
ncbi:pyruvate ferredoxin oxidoreductase [Candidatus Falkowbacteria bacterium]|nr:pyruvate ferredoxin oxidoreductase [Candidatus Falkowbacteria bacterium]